MHLFTSAFLLGILMELQFNSFGFNHGIVVILGLLVIGEAYSQTDTKIEILETIGDHGLLLILPVVLFVGVEAWFHTSEHFTYFSTLELYPLTTIFVLTYAYFRTHGVEFTTSTNVDNNYTVFYGTMAGLMIIKVFEKYFFVEQNLVILGLILLTTLNLLLLGKPKSHTS